MRQRRATRPRCDVCGATAPRVSARWCGRCGAGLSAAAPTTDARGPAGRVGRLVAGALVLAGLALAVATVASRTADRPAVPGGLDVELPGASALPAPVEPDAPGVAGVGRDTGEPPPVVCAGRRRCVAWEVALPPGPHLTGPPTHGLVVVGGGSEVLGVEVATGTVRWRVTRDGGRGLLGTNVATAAGHAVFVTEPDRLRAVDLEVGRTTWTRELTGLRSVEAAETAVGLLHLAVRTAPTEADGTRALLALDPVTGDLRWRHEGRAVVTSAGPVLVREDALVGLDAVEGEGRWELPLELDGRGVRTLALAHHLVVADDAAVHVVDAEDGTVVASASTATATIDGTGVLLHDGDQLGLVTAAGPAWWIPAPDGCCRGLHLGEDGAWVLTDDRVLVLDHGDGAARAEVVPWLDDAVVDVSWWLVGGLLLGYEDRPAGAGAARLLARDARTGAPVARLGSGAPVAVVDRDLLVLMSDRLVRLTAAGPPPARFGGGPAWSPGPA